MLVRACLTLYLSWTSCVFPAYMTSPSYPPERHCLNNSKQNIKVACPNYNSVIHVHSAFLGWSPTNSCEKHSDDCHFAFYAPHVLCEGRQECELKTTLLRQQFNGQDCEYDVTFFIPNYLELSYDCLQGTNIHSKP